MVGVVVAVLGGVEQAGRGLRAGLGDPARRVALTTFELREYRRQLESAIAFFDAKDPIASMVSRRSWRGLWDLGPV